MRRGAATASVVRADVTSPMRPPRRDDRSPAGPTRDPAPEPVRVAKLLARRGVCSRREAERLIDAGLVSVDGVTVREQGAKALPDAHIDVAADAITRLAARLTIALHKPIGIVSTLPEPGQTPAGRLLTADHADRSVDGATAARVAAHPQAFSVAGRLDRASRGLLIMTEDGTVARRIIGGAGVEKCYLVRTAEPPSDAQIRKLRGSLRLDDRPLRSMRVDRVAENQLRFVLVEGRKHQLRRVCRRVGLTVVDLLRLAVGPIRLGDLPEGRWRVVSASELDRLRADGRAGSS
jgi:23S rRNA pseudouridine2604 synthase